MIPTWAADSWVESWRSDLEDGGRTLVALVDRLLDGRPVQGDEGELRGDEERGARREGDGGEHEQPLGHSRSILGKPRGAADPPHTRLLRLGYDPERTLSRPGIRPPWDPVPDRRWFDRPMTSCGDDS